MSKRDYSQMSEDNSLCSATSSKTGSKEKERRKFKVSGKTLHLTYRDHLDHEEMIRFLTKTLGALKWYSIVHEEGHQTGTPYPHTHVAFQTCQKMNFQSERKLDFQGIHPNIKPLATKEHIRRTWEYHEKEPVKLTRSDYCPVQSEDYLTQILNAPSLVEAVKTAGVEVKTVMDIKALRSDRSRDQVIPELENASSWTLEVPGQWRALFLTGPTGTGKTRWALSQFELPLLVSHMEDLKSFRQDLHDGIVFDDFSMKSRTPQEAIHLLDWELPRTINVKHGSVTIPAKTRKIFTSNESFEATFPQCDGQTMPALLRRIRIIHVKGPTYRTAGGVLMTEQGDMQPDLIHLDNDEDIDLSQGLGDLLDGWSQDVDIPAPPAAGGPFNANANAATPNDIGYESEEWSV